MSLNYKQGVPIAIRRYNPKSKQKSRYLYLDKDAKKTSDDEISDAMLASIYGKRETRSRQQRELLRSNHDGEVPQNIHIDDLSNFECVPYSIYANQEDFRRNVFYIVGRAGSGKTYFARQLTAKFRHSVKRIFFVSVVDDDSFGKDVIKIDINKLVGNDLNSEQKKQRYEEAKIKFKYKKKLYADNPDLLMKLELKVNSLKPSKADKEKLMFTMGAEDTKAYFSDSLMIFDDYEDASELEFKKIEFLQNFLLNVGRKTATNMILIRHKANAGHSTSLIKSEATNFVFFAKQSGHAMNYMMKKYMDFDKPQMRTVKQLLKESRWVNINLQEQFVLSQKECQMLD
jgi:adenylate kinase family enzyme